MKGLIKLTMRNAKSMSTEANSMNILKPNVAVFSSLIFLVFSVVDTAAGGDYADGKLGKALILGGNSITVKIPHYAGLKPAKAITISAWIKPKRVGKGGWQWQQIYRKEDGNARALMAIGEYEKKHSLCFGLGISGKYVEHGVPLEPAKLLDGKWHLVSVTFDGKAIKFYADGQEIGASTKATGSIDTQGEAPAYIGSMKGRESFSRAASTMCDSITAPCRQAKSRRWPWLMARPLSTESWAGGSSMVILRIAPRRRRRPCLQTWKAYTHPSCRRACQARGLLTILRIPAQTMSNPQIQTVPYIMEVFIIFIISIKTEGTLLRM